MTEGEPSSDGGISLRDASFRYARSEVLVNAVLDVPKGSGCVVTGPNGSGKSTCLYIAAGLVALDGGSVMLGGHRPNAARPSELMRAGVRRGFVFQEGGLVSNLDALANVALPLRYHADLLRLDDVEVDRRAREALERVRVSADEMLEIPSRLSFGVRKRVSLARAIAIRPNFFYFDDPDFGLDPKTAKIMREILTGFRDDPEVTMLVATNRESLAHELEVPGYVLRAGRFVDWREPSLHPSR